MFLLKNIYIIVNNHTKLYIFTFFRKWMRSVTWEDFYWKNEHIRILAVMNTFERLFVRVTKIKGMTDGQLS